MIHQMASLLEGVRVRLLVAMLRSNILFATLKAILREFLVTGYLVELIFGAVVRLGFVLL